MNIKIFFSLTMLLLALPIAAFAETNPVESKSTITVSPDHPEFTIKIKSNPTTGYSWFLRSYNGNVIAPIKHRFEQPHTNLIGAPGFEVWQFRIKPEGFAVPQQTRIQFVYVRPWETESNVMQKIFIVTTTSR